MRRIALALLLVAVSVPAAWPQASRLRAGYQATFIDPPGSDPLQSALAESAISPEWIYAVTAAGAFGDDQTVHAVDLTDPTSPSFTPVVTGAWDVSTYPAFVNGDNVLDSLFGYIGGLAQLPTGEIVIAENGKNTFEFTNNVGDTLYIARDLNADGDCRDVVGGQPECTVMPVAVPGVSGGNFGGQQTRVAPTGSLYAGDLFIITADGGGNGEIIRIQNPASVSPTATLFATGLNYGAGLAFDGSAVYAGESNFPSPAKLHRFEDLTLDGDADDINERTTLRSDLPGAYDIALTGDGNLRIASNDEILTSSASVSPEPLAGLFKFSAFQFGGDLVAESGGDPFDPHSGTTGQRLCGVGNNFFDTSQIVILTPSEDPAATLTNPLFDLTALSAPSTAGTFNAVVAASPVSPELVYCSVGDFGIQSVWRIDITDPNYPTYKRVATGADDLIGSDNILDSDFGNVGGIAAFPTGELTIVDNALPFSGGSGERVFLARDLNADGDFLDVVTSTPEVAPLVASLPGSGANITATQAVIGPDGAVYIITSDGGDAGEVVRIANPLTSPAPGIFFDATPNGIDFGAGLDFLGADLFVGDADDSFFSARLRRLRDLTPDGDALDPGESAIVTSALGGAVDVGTVGGTDLWLSNFFSIDQLEPSSGSILRTLVTADTLPGFNAIGDIAFTPATSAFTPGAPQRATLITTTNNFLGTSFLYLITPDSIATSSVSNPGLYR